MTQLAASSDPMTPFFSLSTMHVGSVVKNWDEMGANGFAMVSKEGWREGPGEGLFGVCCLLWFILLSAVDYEYGSEWTFLCSLDWFGYENKSCQILYLVSCILYLVSWGGIIYSSP